MIPAEAVEAAMEAYYASGEEPFEGAMRAALEAAGAHMLSPVEDKLAAIIVTLDPFERAASDEAKRRCAFDAVLTIRAILDTK